MFLLVAHLLDIEENVVGSAESSERRRGLFFIVAVYEGVSGAVGEEGEYDGGYQRGDGCEREKQRPQVFSACNGGMNERHDLWY